MKELDSVELIEDIPSADGGLPLIAGDHGAIVHEHANGQAFLVEFIRDGETYTVATVYPAQLKLIRSFTSKE